MRKTLVLTLLGAFFMFAIGALLWTATNQRVYVWLTIGVPLLVLAVGFIGMRRTSDP